MRVAVFAIVLATVLVDLAGAQGRPAPSVSIDTATEEAMASVFLAPGTVVSRNDARISAEIAGRLTDVAEVGTQVARGDVIAAIEDRPLQLQLRENNANIRRLRANAEYLQAQLERFERLAQKSDVTRNQIDELRSQIEMANQDIIRAQVQRDQTLYQIGQTKITAPFNGRVIERSASVGEYTTPGGVVVRLVDTENIEIRVQAPVAVARYLADGMGVAIRDDRGKTQTEIRSVVGVGDERSRMVEVRVALDGAGWIIGSAVRVELPQSEPTVVVAVPRDALILRENATYLYKVNEDNTVQQVPVQTGMGNGSRIEVRGDVVNGDRVVIRGGERLRPGQAVVIIQDS
ncbi:MAG: efflux RND transporter periplasmic adaptor subunit [Gammaproteobacteria bacterium]|nr:efflux RND transporter periplasmic adaptor subunit [Gammaproteobacteria bacterium]NNF61318.1 efflux RND transporter periplasmic adaptor subunit [Gammaproteobacteria bacterium]NNM20102.1 efflux RND transporter periplasmic adaptor subunit [Gammaproteobacteria bacterium]